MTLDEIHEAFLRCQPARDGAWYVQVVSDDRIYLTRAENGSFGLFLRGDLSEFGHVPRSVAISHEDAVRMEPVGVVAPMLRVIAPAKAQGNRALVYLVYEAARSVQDEPSIPNEDLLRRLLWMLVLLEEESVILSPERQRGLVGELQLLARMIRRAKAQRKSALGAIERWHGPWPSKRDFSASGIAVEVKTTSDATRVHNIGSLEQLDPQEPLEEVFVYSIGARHDYSAPRRLMHFVSDVEVLLADVEVDEFRRRLGEYGYDSQRTDLYRAEPGISPFHLEPRFFADVDLLRLRHDSFVGGHPPVPVLGISYRLLLTGEPVPVWEEESILDRLLA